LVKKFQLKAKLFVTSCQKLGVYPRMTHTSATLYSYTTDHIQAVLENVPTMEIRTRIVTQQS